MVTNVVVAFLLAAPAPPVSSFRWSLKEGDIFRYKVSTNTEQKMNVQGADVEQTQQMFFTYRYKVLHANKDGSVSVEQLVEDFGGVISIGGQKTTLDFANAIRGAKFAFTLTSNGTVKDFAGLPAFIERVPEQQREMLKMMLTEESLQQGVSDLFAIVPPKREVAEKTWVRTSTYPMGPIGTCTTKNTYKLAGKAKKDGKEYDKVQWVPEVRFSPPAPGQGGALPFTIKSLDLKCDDGPGSLLFDRKSGRVIESEATMKLKGPMTIEIGGQETMLTLDQTVKSTTVLLPAK